VNAPTVGSLFSGIGGLDLGLERAGFRVAWQCESDEYARAVLRKHWPDVPCYEDVRALDGSEPGIDLLCGGFPCQDLSVAGKRAGIDGARSGLWREFARVIGLLRPQFVLVENVPGLLAGGLGRVLGDLAACGYDAEWDCLRASDVGAPHKRERVFLVAYSRHRPVAERSRETRREARQRTPERALARGRGADVADGDRQHGARAASHPPADHQWNEAGRGGWWRTEPDVGRVAHGVPARVDRLRTLGNAVVPQVAEWIGRQILAAWKGQVAA
jgi:DNA (cytosine-5)-methyltransferase 1